MGERKTGGFEADLVIAMQAGTLGEFLIKSTPDERNNELYERGLKTLQKIREDSLRIGKEVVMLLGEKGIEAVFDSENLEDSFPQFQSATVSLPLMNPTSAMTCLEGEGYFTPFSLQSGAWEAYRRVRSQITLTRKDEVGSRVVLCWQNRKRGIVGLKKFCPNEYEGELWKLPASLWPLAFFGKPWRMLGERMGWREEKNLGHWLATPHSLLSSIFEAIDLGKDDVLVDLGCGDGRVLIEGVKFSQCNAIGLEINERLISEAARQVETAGLKESITLKLGGMDLFDASQVSVVFLFLPAKIAGTMIPRLLETLRPGARIVAHEQSPLHGVAPVEELIPVFGERAMTVLSVWKRGEK